MTEAFYIIDDEGNLIVTDEGDKIITDGVPPPEVDALIKMGLSLGLSMGQRSTF